MTRLMLALALVVTLTLGMLAPGHAGPLCGTGGSLGQIIYQQLTVSSTAVSLTVPTNALYAVVIVGSNTIRVRDDGTAPTASIGMPYGATTYPQSFTICGSAIATTQLIRAGSSDAEVNVSYYK